MYTLRKTFRFEASHQLVHHDGKCKRLHGHSWKFTVELKAPELQSEGPQKNMVLDFGDISKIVRPIIDQYLDHHHLNNTLQNDSPTSEYVAGWLYNKIKQNLPNLAAVTVYETCTSECRYEGE